jgi:hypothetical protein
MHLSRVLLALCQTRAPLVLRFSELVDIKTACLAFESVVAEGNRQGKNALRRRTIYTSNFLLESPARGLKEEMSVLILTESLVMCRGVVPLTEHPTVNVQ